MADGNKTGSSSCRNWRRLYAVWLAKCVSYSVLRYASSGKIWISTENEVGDVGRRIVHQDVHDLLQDEEPARGLRVEPSPVAAAGERVDAIAAPKRSAERGDEAPLERVRLRHGPRR